MLVRSEVEPEVRRLMRRARETGPLSVAQEQRLRALLARHELRALTMSREELYRFGALFVGIHRLLDVVEGRAVIVDT